MTDAQIREVLLATQNCMLNRLPKKEWKHEFSKMYCRNKRKLIARDRHPMIYWIRKIAAILLLILGLSGGVILGFSEEVRAEVFRWIIEKIADNTYKYQNKADEDVDISGYSLANSIPEGYQCIDRIEEEYSTDEVYVNQQGELLIFRAIRPGAESEIYVVSDKDHKPYETTNIHGNTAQLYISENSGESNVIVWQGRGGVLFFIQGILEKKQLIELAESVE